jgi:hypothetical protein
MPNSRFIDEYLVSVKPSFDKSAWSAASGNISEMLNNAFSGPQKEASKLQEELKNKLQANAERMAKIKARLSEEGVGDEEKASLNEELKTLKTDSQQLSTALQQSQKSSSAFSSGLTKGAGYLAAFTMAVSIAKEAALKLADAATEVSNKFISQSSIFVDTDVRDIMGKFGVNSTTAQAISESAGLLDIDLSDYSKLTQGQRKAFADLMQYYQDRIDQIDLQKLEQFNEATQEYQLMVAKFQMDLKLSVMEMLAESGALPELLETLSTFMGTITDILSSEAFKTGADIVIGIINGILKFVTAPFNFFGKLFSGGSDTTNNTSNTVNVNTTVNSSGGVDTEQLALDIGMQVQNALTR